MVLWDVSNVFFRDMKQQGHLKLWKKQIWNPIHQIKISPHDQYIASCGKNDKLLKIWYTYNNPFQFTIEKNPNEVQENENLRFIYLPHPRGIISFDWRDTRNVAKKISTEEFQETLLTSCHDNVNRLWTKVGNPDPSPNEAYPNFHLVSVLQLNDFQKGIKTVSVGWVKTQGKLKFSGNNETELKDYENSHGKAKSKKNRFSKIL